MEKKCKDCKFHSSRHTNRIGFCHHFGMFILGETPICLDFQEEIPECSNGICCSGNPSPSCEKNCRFFPGWPGED